MAGPSTGNPPARRAAPGRPGAVPEAVAIALWLERDLDPGLPPAEALDALRRAFPGATLGRLRAALGLALRTLGDRAEAEEADLDAVLALLRGAATPALRLGPASSSPPAPSPARVRARRASASCCRRSWMRAKLRTSSSSMRRCAVGAAASPSPPSKK